MLKLFRLILSYGLPLMTAVGVCECEAAVQQMPDSVVTVNAKGERIARSYFRYDKSGRQTMVMHYVLNKRSKKWLGTFKEEATYDKAGNVVQKMTSHWKMEGAGRWFATVDEKYSFDGDGRLVSKDLRKWNEERNEWVGTERQDLKLDAKGAVVQCTDYDWDYVKHEWVCKKKVDVKRDGEGRSVEEVECAYGDERWQLSERRTMVYEGFAGNYKELVTEHRKGSSWVKVRQQNFEYNNKPDGRLFQIEVKREYDLQTGNNTQVVRETKVFDDKGGLTEYIADDYAPQGWVRVRQEKWELDYDQFGNKVKDAYYIWNGKDDWMGVSQVTAAYNAKGELLAESKMNYDNVLKIWVGVVNSQYEYDEKGNNVSEIKLKWNVDRKAWEYLSRMTFEYDGNGNKIGETSAQWSGAAKKWVVFYVGKMEYVYDKAGNVKEVKEMKQDEEDGSWVVTKIVNYY